MKRILVAGFCTEDVISGEHFFGGAAGGIVLNLAKLGISVGILSVLGTDDFSKNYLKEFRHLHVDLSLLSVVTERLPLLEVVTDNGKELGRNFRDFGCKNALAHLIPDPLLLSHFDTLHVVNTPRRLADCLAQTFTGTFSYSPGSLFIRDPDSLSQQLLQKTTYLFLNEEESQSLESIIPTAELLKEHLKMLCISHGESGVMVKTKQREWHVPAIKTPVIDTTGAGDAIVVGFFSKILQEESIEISIDEGIRLASLVIQRKSGQIF